MGLGRESRPRASHAPWGPLHGPPSARRMLSAAAQVSSPVDWPRANLATSGRPHTPLLSRPPGIPQREPGVPVAALLFSGTDAHVRPGRHTPGARDTAQAPHPAIARCCSSLFLPSVRIRPSPGLFLPPGGLLSHAAAGGGWSLPFHARWGLRAPAQLPAVHPVSGARLPF
ncbi:hypothetical protein NDU88_003332 [Pleurodeles waltl]|uniref:Uncharacterized protein n=1 Tax=Pleurodeles waltl TaxID=8319 RepID=A0AAV7VDW6_PLEWA|nr:hypothetical protein NDU88_003332 [Pleurodeles waltl]